MHKPYTRHFPYSFPSHIRATAAATAQPQSQNATQRDHTNKEGGPKVGVSGLCHFLCVIMPFCPQNYAKIMPRLCPGLCQNYAVYAKIMPFMLKLCFYALCQNYAKLCQLCSPGAGPQNAEAAKPLVRGSRDPRT